MRGILLAGGSSSRMGPATAIVSKQFLPVYDKPLIYYPLSTLMLADIRDILVILRPDEADRVAAFLGDGSDFGINLTYAVQGAPRGIAEALVIGKEFLDGGPCCLVLGDNILLGGGLGTSLRHLHSSEFANVLGYSMADPRAYAVAHVGDDGLVTRLIEKPELPGEGLAVPGIYFFPADAPTIAAGLTPSHRGELEITDLNLQYMATERLRLRVLPRSAYWMDAGTPERLLEAGQFVRALSEREGKVIACPEDIAYTAGWIGRDLLSRRAKKFASSRYGEYLMRLSSAHAD